MRRNNIRKRHACDPESLKEQLLDIVLLEADKPIREINMEVIRNGFDVLHPFCDEEDAKRTESA